MAVAPPTRDANASTIATEMTYTSKDAGGDERPRTEGPQRPPLRADRECRGEGDDRQVAPDGRVEVRLAQHEPAGRADETERHHDPESRQAEAGRSGDVAARWIEARGAVGGGRQGRPADDHPLERQLERQGIGHDARGDQDADARAPAARAAHRSRRPPRRGSRRPTAPASVNGIAGRTAWPRWSMRQLDERDV